MNKPKKSTTAERVIAKNKKAFHDYAIEDRFEAGLVLEGWEVKSLRDHRVQLKESYVLLKDGEAWLIGMHISPLSTVSTHITADPLRSRKLLLHRRELAKLLKAKQQQGYTVVPLDLHWRGANAKVSIALAKGKKQHDKRVAERQKDWKREQGRLLKATKQ